MIPDAEPHSTKELAAIAEDFEFYIEQPLRSWLRSAKVLFSQAASSEREGDLELAFVYTFRYVALVTDRLRQYSAHERARFKDDLKQEEKRAVQCFAKLESWKPKINARYEKYTRAQAVRRAALQTTITPDEDEDFDHEHVDVAQNKDLAVQLARQELLRRSASDGPTHQSISSMMQATRKLVDGNQTRTQPSAYLKHEQYDYPQVKREALQDWSSPLPSTPSKLGALPPEIPIKVEYSSPPDIPSKAGYSSPPSLPIKEPPSSQVKFKISAYTESGQGLRTVMLPASLQQKFLDLADKNTARNLETCGVLGATLVSNALVITHLIIPDQTSTSDTCDTTDDGDVALFDYCEQQNLISCGWIHTHPSQTCFLSSRDLHTSAGYQQMLAEAIAIVCAPRHNPSIGIFRLTSPPGLPAILKCTTPGLFHLHAEQNLYTDAASPGHVVEDSKLDFKIVDLRR